MRIAIVGVGGVGGYLAVKLAETGREVAAVARGAHLEAIRERGLTLRAPEGERAAALAGVVERPAEIGSVDLVIVAVKGQDLDALDFRPLIGPETIVLPFLNGVEATERLDASLGAGRTLIGVARISATIVEPGVVALHGPFARFAFGEPDGRRSRRVEALLDLFRAAGIEAAIDPEPRRALWTKLLFLGPFSAVTAAARCDAATLRATPELRALFRRLAEETAAVARAEGVALGEAEVETVLAALDGLPPGMRASLAHDLAAGKRLEIDWLSGAVVRIGARHGVPTPASETAAALLAPWREGRAR